MNSVLSLNAWDEGLGQKKGNRGHWSIQTKGVHNLHIS